MSEKTLIVFLCLEPVTGFDVNKLFHKLCSACYAVTNNFDS